MTGDLMYVSKDRSVLGDLYIESDAEEIYLPDSHLKRLSKRKGQLAPPEETGIVGYQKYLHIVNRMAVDNTDAYEPSQPQISQFVRVQAAEHEQELRARVERQLQQAGRGRHAMNIGSLLEEQGESSMSDDEDQEEEEEEDQEKIQRFSKFNFSGMSFKDYVGNIPQKDLNSEIIKLVAIFTKQKMDKHHGTHLSQRKVQVKHPIFRLISINAFKYIIDHAFLFKLKAG